MKPESIYSIAFKLTIDEAWALYLFFDADGLMKRMGTLSGFHQDTNLYCSISGKPIFEEIRRDLTPELLEHTGAYQVPHPKGKTCIFQVELATRDGEKDGFTFQYGQDSAGLPDEMGALLRKAVSLTDPWYFKASSEKTPWN